MSALRGKDIRISLLRRANEGWECFASDRVESVAKILLYRPGRIRFWNPMNAVRAQPLTIESRTVRTPILPEEAATDIFPLSFAQEGLWFMEQFAPGNATYNIPEGWWLRGRVERDALQKALDAVVARHETLRTTLGVREDRPVQIIGPPRPFALTFKDVSRHKEAELVQ